MFAMWLVGRLIAVLLAFLVASTCTGPMAWGSPEAQPTLQYGAPPDWGSCADFVGSTAAIPTAQCAMVNVPIDYAKPNGPQAHLAVIRVPASGDRIGALMINPGGPGASAVDTVAGMAVNLADTDVTRRFDLVGFDPRGVGHSTPQVRCRSDAEFDAYRREPMA